MDNQISVTPEPQSSAPAIGSPEQPDKPSSRNWKKWLLPVLSMALITVGGGNLILSQQKSEEPETKTLTQPTVAHPSPTPNPTADWKTYTNTKYGYTIKYPENTKIDTNLDAAITFSRNITPKPGGGGQGVCCGMTIYFRPYGYIVNYSVSKDTTINGYTAKLVNHATYNHSVYINNPNKTNSIEVSISTGAAIEPYDNEDFQTFNQILQTFKFTESSPSLNTTSPKIACEQSGGKWLAQYNECEATSGVLDEKTCKDLGGTVTECASACRHDPNAQGCIEVCINVCKF